MRSLSLFAPAVLTLLLALPVSAELRVGAVVVDVTPPDMPVIVNGGILSRTVDKVKTPISARAMVIDDGDQRIAIVVVDSCMMPQFLLDDAKALASQRTKIQPDRMLISATHTHTAPSAMGALGTDPDPRYVPYLREKLAEAIASAEANLAPAHVGWTTVDADKFTALRRWIRRPDRIDDDPFGNPTIRANMHAARVPENVTGPSGPEDPEVSLISFASPDGQPIAVLANFSMHYFGDSQISADYYGLLCNAFQDRVAQSETAAKEKSPEQEPGASPSMVAMMSHGCSGDIWRRDYTAGPDGNYNPTLENYTTELLDLIYGAYKKIEHKPVDSIAMAENRLPMMYRLPDAQRLQWAQQIVDSMEGELPKTIQEVYAREQVLLHELQSTDVVVQGIRIGDIGISTTPTETYALTGLKLKLQSPFAKQMVIELANGGDGYIPPPEQHHLGGYNTWAARSAGLEVQAEPKITEANLQLLEQLAGKPRRPFVQTAGELTQAIQAADPFAFYRLDHMDGSIAIDSSKHHRDASVSPGYALFLEGPAQPGVCETDEINRAIHLAGGRLQTRLPSGQADYSVAMWIWNGMPNDGRETTGWIVSRDRPYQTSSFGEHLGIGGTATDPGKLIFVNGDGKPVTGQTTLERWSWNHVVMTRSGDKVRVYLNGSKQPEIETTAAAASVSQVGDLFIGGRSDNDSNFEGRIDEVAIFDRALEPAQLETLLVEPVQ
ncbi:Neutral/alkaline non-lysosomal ceramidase [Rosistilla oblonga]|nr:Neutral/alkaline non-lysosomal ceramidase [Rosistilla oblonga]